MSLAGEYVGMLADHPLPDGFGPDWRMAVVETDELGVERVVVKRVPEAWR